MPGPPKPSTRFNPTVHPPTQRPIWVALSTSYRLPSARNQIHLALSPRCGAAPVHASVTRSPSASETDSVKPSSRIMLLNAFLFRPPGDETADCNSMRSSNDGTAILYAQHPHSEACYLLSRLSGTTSAPRAVCFDKSTLAASIAPSAPSVAPLKPRGAPPTNKDTIKSNIKRALCKEDAGTASLTGAAFPSSLLQISGSRALIGSSTIIGLTRMLYRMTKNRHADVPSEAVYSVSSPISVKCISPTPQAAVSLTETLILPSSIHYTDFHAQAVVPPTGTTPLFYPPPPPESEPYNTGQTQ